MSFLPKLIVDAGTSILNAVGLHTSEQVADLQRKHRGTAVGQRKCAKRQFNGFNKNQPTSRRPRTTEDSESNPAASRLTKEAPTLSDEYESNLAHCNARPCSNFGDQNDHHKVADRERPGYQIPLRCMIFKMRMMSVLLLLQLEPHSTSDGFRFQPVDAVSVRPRRRRMVNGRGTTRNPPCFQSFKLGDKLGEGGERIAKDLL